MDLNTNEILEWYYLLLEFRRKYQRSQIESQGKKQGRFPSTLKTYASMLFHIKGTIRGKDITISIAPVEHNIWVLTLLMR